jgi:hypothetical protein
MSQPEDLASRLWTSVQTIRDFADLHELLAKIDNHRERNELADSVYFELVRTALSASRTMVFDNVTVAERLIRERLVPLALEMPPDDDRDAQLEVSNCRRLLASWIDDFPEQERELVRQRVLAALMTALSDGPVRPACWTIAEIGYRDDHIVERLWSIVDGGTEDGVAALNAIVALGVPRDMRGRVVKGIEAESHWKSSRPPLYAIQELAVPETVDVLLAFIERLERQEEGFQLDVLTVGSLLNKVLDESWDDHSLHARVWSQLGQVAEREFVRGRKEFDCRYDVGEHCNSPRVIEYFLTSLLKTAPGKDGTFEPYWFPLGRLNDCFRPLHVRGWTMVGNRAELIDAMGRLALLDTKSKGGVVTAETRAKKDVWNHLLSVGAPRVVDWIEEAVRNETSLYVQSDVLECAACLALPHLPPSVETLVTEECNLEPKSDGAPLIVRLSATDVARSAASLEAFEVLLNFGFTHRGSVLVSSVEAIEEVALTLFRSVGMDTRPILMARALEAPTQRQREGAIAALFAFAKSGHLEEKAIQTLLAAFCDGSLPLHSREQALEAIGYLPREAVQDNEVAFIRQIARGETDHPESSRWRALECLIRHRVVPGVEDEALLKDRLRLAQHGGGWWLEDASTIDEWQGFSIVLLWSMYPDNFAKAVAEVVRRADMLVIFPTLAVLYRQRANTDNPSQGVAPIVESVVDRIKSRMTKGVAETLLFGVLRNLDPERLMAESWDRLWGNWLPDAQVALADELAQAVVDDPLAVSHGVSLLIVLSGEGTYAVRRAAYRAMSRINQKALDDHCIELAKQSVDERRRAAEASGWSQEHGDEKSEKSVLAALLVDSERSVREAARRCVRERRTRLWADGYLEKVLAVRGRSNEEVLATYCYGQSLIQTGDEDHQRRLEQHLATPDLPPHVRHWLRRIVDGIEKQWRKVTEKWPEPWLGWGGTVEEVDGALVFDDSDRCDVRFSLWRKGRVSMSDRYSWGGIIRSSSIPREIHFRATTYVKLRIPGRNDADALVTEKNMRSDDPTSVIMLVGTGVYPDVETAPSLTATVTPNDSEAQE